MQDPIINPDNKPIMLQNVEQNPEVQNNPYNPSGNPVEKMDAGTPAPVTKYDLTKILQDGVDLDAFTKTMKQDEFVAVPSKDYFLKSNPELANDPTFNTTYETLNRTAEQMNMMKQMNVNRGPSAQLYGTPQTSASAILTKNSKVDRFGNPRYSDQEFAYAQGYQEKDAYGNWVTKQFTWWDKHGELAVGLATGGGASILTAGLLRPDFTPSVMKGTFVYDTDEKTGEMIVRKYKSFDDLSGQDVVNMWGPQSLSNDDIFAPLAGFYSQFAPMFFRSGLTMTKAFIDAGIGIAAWAGGDTKEEQRKLAEQYHKGGVLSFVDKVLSSGENTYSAMNYTPSVQIQQEGFTGSLESFGYHLAETVGQLIAQVAFTYVTGGAGAGAAMLGRIGGQAMAKTVAKEGLVKFAKSIGSKVMNNLNSFAAVGTMASLQGAYDGARQNGLSRENAGMFTAAVSPMVFLTERLLSAGYFGKLLEGGENMALREFKNGALKDMVAKTVEKFGINGAVKPVAAEFAQKTLSNTTKKFFKDLAENGTIKTVFNTTVKAGAREGSQESLEESGYITGETVFDQWFGDVSPFTKDGAEPGDGKFGTGWGTEGTANRLYQSFIGGFSAGFVSGAGGHIVRKTIQKRMAGRPGFYDDKTDAKLKLIARGEENEVFNLMKKKWQKGEWGLKSQDINGKNIPIDIPESDVEGVTVDHNRFEKLGLPQGTKLTTLNDIGYYNALQTWEADVVKGRAFIANLGGNAVNSAVYEEMAQNKVVFDSMLDSMNDIRRVQDTMEDTMKEIETLKQSGGDTTALEAEVQGMQAEIQKGTEAFRREYIYDSNQADKLNNDSKIAQLQEQKANEPENVEIDSQIAQLQKENEMLSADTTTRKKYSKALLSNVRTSLYNMVTKQAKTPDQVQALEDLTIDTISNVKKQTTARLEQQAKKLQEARTNVATKISSLQEIATKIGTASPSLNIPELTTSLKEGLLELNSLFPDMANIAPGYDSRMLGKKIHTSYKVLLDTLSKQDDLVKGMGFASLVDDMSEGIQLPTANIDTAEDPSVDISNSEFDKEMAKTLFDDINERVSQLKGIEESGQLSKALHGDIILRLGEDIEKITTFINSLKDFQNVSLRSHIPDSSSVKNHLRTLMVHQTPEYKTDKTTMLYNPDLEGNYDALKAEINNLTNRVGLGVKQKIEKEYNRTRMLIENKLYIISRIISEPETSPDKDFNTSHLALVEAWEKFQREAPERMKGEGFKIDDLYKEMVDYELRLVELESKMPALKLDVETVLNNILGDISGRYFELGSASIRFTNHLKTPLANLISWHNNNVVDEPFYEWLASNGITDYTVGMRIDKGSDLYASMASNIEMEVTNYVNRITGTKTADFYSLLNAVMTESDTAQEKDNNRPMIGQEELLRLAMNFLYSENDWVDIGFPGEKEARRKYMMSIMGLSGTGKTLMVTTQMLRLINMVEEQRIKKASDEGKTGTELEPREILIISPSEELVNDMHPKDKDGNSMLSSVKIVSKTHSEFFSEWGEKGNPDVLTAMSGYAYVIFDEASKLSLDDVSMFEKTILEINSKEEKKNNPVKFIFTGDNYQAVFSDFDSARSLCPVGESLIHGFELDHIHRSGDEFIHALLDAISRSMSGLSVSPIAYPTVFYNDTKTGGVEYVNTVDQVIQRWMVDTSDASTLTSNAPDGTPLKREIIFASAADAESFIEKNASLTESQKANVRYIIGSPTNTTLGYNLVSIHGRPATLAYVAIHPMDNTTDRKSYNTGVGRASTYVLTVGDPSKSSMDNNKIINYSDTTTNPKYAEEVEKSNKEYRELATYRLKVLAGQSKEDAAKGLSEGIQPDAEEVDGDENLKDENEPEPNEAIAYREAISDLHKKAANASTNDMYMATIALLNEMVNQSATIKFHDTRNGKPDHYYTARIGSKEYEFKSVTTAIDKELPKHGFWKSLFEPKDDTNTTKTDNVSFGNLIDEATTFFILSEYAARLKKSISSQEKNLISNLLSYHLALSKEQGSNLFNDDGSLKSEKEYSAIFTETTLSYKPRNETDYKDYSYGKSAIAAIKKRTAEIMKGYDFIIPQMTVFDFSNKVAGRIDLFGIKDGNVSIIDTKAKSENSAFWIDKNGTLSNHNRRNGNISVISKNDPATPTALKASGKGFHYLYKDYPQQTLYAELLGRMGFDKSEILMYLNIYDAQAEPLASEKGAPTISPVFEKVFDGRNPGNLVQIEHVGKYGDGWVDKILPKKSVPANDVAPLVVKQTNSIVPIVPSFEPTPDLKVGDVVVHETTGVEGDVTQENPLEITPIGFNNASVIKSGTGFKKKYSTNNHGERKNEARYREDKVLPIILATPWIVAGQPTLKIMKNGQLVPMAFKVGDTLTQEEFWTAVNADMGWKNSRRKYMNGELTVSMSNDDDFVWHLIDGNYQLMAVKIAAIKNSDGIIVGQLPLPTGMKMVDIQSTNRIDLVPKLQDGSLSVYDLALFDNWKVLLAGGKLGVKINDKIDRVVTPVYKSKSTQSFADLFNQLSGSYAFRTMSGGVATRLEDVHIDYVQDNGYPLKNGEPRGSYVVRVKPINSDDSEYVILDIQFNKLSTADAKRVIKNHLKDLKNLLPNHSLDIEKTNEILTNSPIYKFIMQNIRLFASATKVPGKRSATIWTVNEDYEDIIEIRMLKGDDAGKYRINFKQDRNGGLIKASIAKLLDVLYKSNPTDVVDTIDFHTGKGKSEITTHAIGITDYPFGNLYPISQAKSNANQRVPVAANKNNAKKLLLPKSETLTPSYNAIATLRRIFGDDFVNNNLEWMPNPKLYDGKYLLGLVQDGKMWLALDEFGRTYNNAEYHEAVHILMGILDPASRTKALELAKRHMLLNLEDGIRIPNIDYDNITDFQAEEFIAEVNRDKATLNERASKGNWLKRLINWFRELIGRPRSGDYLEELLYDLNNGVYNGRVGEYSRTGAFKLEQDTLEQDEDQINDSDPNPDIEDTSSTVPMSVLKQKLGGAGNVQRAKERVLTLFFSETKHSRENGYMANQEMELKNTIISNYEIELEAMDVESDPSRAAKINRMIALLRQTPIERSNRTDIEAFEVVFELMRNRIVQSQLPTLEEQEAWSEHSQNYSYDYHDTNFGYKKHTAKNEDGTINKSAIDFKTDNYLDKQLTDNPELFNSVVRLLLPKFNFSEDTIGTATKRIGDSNQNINMETTMSKLVKLYLTATPSFRFLREEDEFNNVSYVIINSVEHPDLSILSERKRIDLRSILDLLHEVAFNYQYYYNKGEGKSKDLGEFLFEFLQNRADSLLKNEAFAFDKNVHLDPNELTDVATHPEADMILSIMYMFNHNGMSFKYFEAENNGFSLNLIHENYGLNEDETYTEAITPYMSFGLMSNLSKFQQLMFKQAGLTVTPEMLLRITSAPNDDVLEGIDPRIVDIVRNTFEKSKAAQTILSGLIGYVNSVAENNFTSIELKKGEYGMKMSSNSLTNDLKNSFVKSLTTKFDSVFRPTGQDESGNLTTDDDVLFSDSDPYLKTSKTDISIDKNGIINFKVGGKRSQEIVIRGKIENGRLVFERTATSNKNLTQGIFELFKNLGFNPRIDHKAIEAVMKLSSSSSALTEADFGETGKITSQHLITLIGLLYTPLIIRHSKTTDTQKKDLRDALLEHLNGRPIEFNDAAESSLRKDLKKRYQKEKDPVKKEIINQNLEVLYSPRPQDFWKELLVLARTVKKYGRSRSKNIISVASGKKYQRTGANNRVKRFFGYPSDNLGGGAVSDGLRNKIISEFRGKFAALYRDSPLMSPNRSGGNVFMNGILSGSTKVLGSREATGSVMGYSGKATDKFNAAERVMNQIFGIFHHGITSGNFYSVIANTFGDKKFNYVFDVQMNGMAIIGARKGVLDTFVLEDANINQRVFDRVEAQLTKGFLSLASLVVNPKLVFQTENGPGVTIADTVKAYLKSHGNYDDFQLDEIVSSKRSFEAFLWNAFRNDDLGGKYASIIRGLQEHIQTQLTRLYNQSNKLDFISNLSMNGAIRYYDYNFVKQDGKEIVVLGNASGFRDPLYKLTAFAWDKENRENVVISPMYEMHKAHLKWLAAVQGGDAFAELEDAVVARRLIYQESYKALSKFFDSEKLRAPKSINNFFDNRKFYTKTDTRNFDWHPYYELFTLTKDLASRDINELMAGSNEQFKNMTLQSARSKHALAEGTSFTSSETNVHMAPKNVRVVNVMDMLIEGTGEAFNNGQELENPFMTPFFINSMGGNSGLASSNDKVMKRRQGTVNYAAGKADDVKSQTMMVGLDEMYKTAWGRDMLELMLNGSNARFDVDSVEGAMLQHNNGMSLNEAYKQRLQTLDLFGTLESFINNEATRIILEKYESDHDLIKEALARLISNYEETYNVPTGYVEDDPATYAQAIRSLRAYEKNPAVPPLIDAILAKIEAEKKFIDGTYMGKLMAQKQLVISNNKQLWEAVRDKMYRHIVMIRSSQQNEIDPLEAMIAKIIPGETRKVSNAYTNNKNLFYRTEDAFEGKQTLQSVWFNNDDQVLVLNPNIDSDEVRRLSQAEFIMAVGSPENQARHNTIASARTKIADIAIVRFEGELKSFAKRYGTPFKALSEFLKSKIEANVENINQSELYTFLAQSKIVHASDLSLRQKAIHVLGGIYNKMVVQVSSGIKATQTPDYTEYFDYSVKMGDETITLTLTEDEANSGVWDKYIGDQKGTVSSRLSKYMQFLDEDGNECIVIGSDGKPRLDPNRKVVTIIPAEIRLGYDHFAHYDFFKHSITIDNKGLRASTMNEMLTIKLPNGEFLNIREFVKKYNGNENYYTNRKVGLNALHAFMTSKEGFGDRSIAQEIVNYAEALLHESLTMGGRIPFSSPSSGFLYEVTGFGYDSKYLAYISPFKNLFDNSDFDIDSLTFLINSYKYQDGVYKQTHSENENEKELKRLNNVINNVFADYYTDPENAGLITSIVGTDLIDEVTREDAEKDENSQVPGVVAEAQIASNVQSHADMVGITVLYQKAYSFLMSIPEAKRKQILSKFSFDNRGIALRSTEEWMHDNRPDLTPEQFEYELNKRKDNRYIISTVGSLLQLFVDGLKNPRASYLRLNLNSIQVGITMALHGYTLIDIKAALSTNVAKHIFEIMDFGDRQTEKRADLWTASYKNLKLLEGLNLEDRLRAYFKSKFEKNKYLLELFEKKIAAYEANLEEDVDFVELENQIRDIEDKDTPLSNSEGVLLRRLYLERQRSEYYNMTQDEKLVRMRERLAEYKAYVENTPITIVKNGLEFVVGFRDNSEDEYRAKLKQNYIEAKVLHEMIIDSTSMSRVLTAAQFDQDTKTRADNLFRLEETMLYNMDDEYWKEFEKTYDNTGGENGYYNRTQAVVDNDVLKIVSGINAKLSEGLSISSIVNAGGSGIEESIAKASMASGIDTSVFAWDKGSVRDQYYVRHYGSAYNGRQFFKELEQSRSLINVNPDNPSSDEEESRKGVAEKINDYVKDNINAVIVLGYSDDVLDVYKNRKYHISAHKKSQGKNAVVIALNLNRFMTNGGLDSEKISSFISARLSSKFSNSEVKKLQLYFTGVDMADISNEQINSRQIFIMKEEEIRKRANLKLFMSSAKLLGNNYNNFQKVVSANEANVYIIKNKYYYPFVRRVFGEFGLVTFQRSFEFSAIRDFSTGVLLSFAMNDFANNNVMAVPSSRVPVQLSTRKTYDKTVNENMTFDLRNPHEQLGYCFAFSKEIEAATLSKTISFGGNKEFDLTGNLFFDNLRTDGSFVVMETQELTTTGRQRIQDAFNKLPDEIRTKFEYYAMLRFGFEFMGGTITDYLHVIHEKLANTVERFAKLGNVDGFSDPQIEHFFSEQGPGVKNAVFSTMLSLAPREAIIDNREVSENDSYNEAVVLNEANTLNTGKDSKVTKVSIETNAKKVDGSSLYREGYNYKDENGNGEVYYPASHGMLKTVHIEGPNYYQIPTLQPTSFEEWYKMDQAIINNSNYTHVIENYHNFAPGDKVNIGDSTFEVESATSNKVKFKNLNPKNECK